MFFKNKNNEGSAVDLNDAPSVKDDSGGDEDEFLGMLAEDLLESLGSKDKAGIVEVLKAFMTLIESRDLEQDEQA